jgi:hypothetical protein
MMLPDAIAQMSDSGFLDPSGRHVLKMVDVEFIKKKHGCEGWAGESAERE